MHLSIVIPAYNEEQRIAGTLEAIDAYLSRQGYDSEVIVVDDGSTDQTVSAVHDAFPDTVVISYGPNRGKGHAVRTGMSSATGAYRLYFDADASTPIEEVDKLWPCFDAGADIVIGSRSLPDSDVQVHQPWYRENMGRAFNVLVRGLGLTRFLDTQCGFKAFTAHACDVVFSRQTIERFSFDAELLHIAEVHGLRVDEIPVRWMNCPQTRVKAVRDSVTSFVDVLSVRYRDFRGLYR